MSNPAGPVTEPSGSVAGNNLLMSVQAFRSEDYLTIASNLLAQNIIENDRQLLGTVTILLCVVLVEALVIVWLLWTPRAAPHRVTTFGPQRPHPTCHNLNTQSQTSYTHWTSNPRFHLLPIGQQGAWVEPLTDKQVQDYYGQSA